MPAYTVGLTVVTVVAMCLLTLWGGVTISNNNARRLVTKYEADKASTAAQNQVVYCNLFQSQLEAFDSATSDVGKRSYEGWLQVYRLAKCQPAR